MSIIAGTAIESALGGYQMDYGLRFNSADSAYLSRTPASAGNRKTWTLSMWVKRSKLASASGETLFFAYDTGASPWNGTNVYFLSNDKLRIQQSGSPTNFYYDTDMVFRDVGAWYHIMIAIDLTQSTSTNRIKFYVNGSQVSAPYAGGLAVPGPSDDTWVNAVTIHNIGTSVPLSAYFNGYMSDVYLIDGQQLDPTSFGEFNPDTGVWQPIEYAGTYGTNGFHLPFNQEYPSINADFLVVAGGGGGGYGGGGGGAGGYQSLTTQPLLVGYPIAVKVGAGGAGSTSAGVGGNIGNLGNQSTFNTTSSGGGGAGGSSNSGVYNVNITPGSAGNSVNGSGAGGAYTSSSAGGSGSGSGGNGGAGNGSVSGSGGGSGGNGSTGGAGGSGTANTITGSSVTYAAGGGSSGSAAGSANTGNGGGGGGSGANNGGNGGSGIVIVKLPNTHYATFSGGVTSSITTLTGYNAYSVTATSTTSETMTINEGTPISDLLVVGGGGGGGFAYGGGGGAGGFRTSTSQIITLGTSYTVTVGAGGGQDTNGSNSTFGSFTAAGGGGGKTNAAGQSGGSGAGGSGNDNGTAGSGNTPSTSPSQGNNGGAGNPTSGNSGGGGGGAGAAGSAASGSNPGNGGNGSSYSITGSSVTYAGGGAGGPNYNASSGASGGSGGGGNSTRGGAGGNGTANLGGGGGGGSQYPASTYYGPGNGGSGVVIIKVRDNITATFSGGVTSSLTTSGGYKIYTVTATSTTSETVTFS